MRQVLTSAPRCETSVEVRIVRAAVEGEVLVDAGVVRAGGHGA